MQTGPLTPNNANTAGGLVELDGSGRLPAVSGQLVLLTSGSTLLAGDGAYGIGNVSVGTGLIYSGGTLSCPTIHGVKLFTSTGSWTAPSGITSVLLTIQGAGGSGGSGNSGGNNTAGGGAGGSYLQSFYYAVTSGNTYTVTIGTGGTGVTGGADGHDGGSTSFDSVSVPGGGKGFAYGNGGAGGISPSSSTTSLNGSTSTAGSQIIPYIKTGNGGAYAVDHGGGGGATYFGNGGAGAPGGQNGNPGTGYGAGGSGCYGNNGYTSGSGVSGFVLVQW